MKFFKIWPRFTTHARLECLVPTHNVLKSCRAEEVLLLEAQLLALHHLRINSQSTRLNRPSQLAAQAVVPTSSRNIESQSKQTLLMHPLTYIVIRVEDTGYILRQVSVQHSLDVVPMVNCWCVSQPDRPRNNKQRIHQHLIASSSVHAMMNYGPSHP